jgi:glycosyltransferase involved in cell wall biosynthesis
MQSLKNKTLALFLTRGMSLRRWDELGMLAREVKLYRFHAQQFKKLIIVTYGKEDAEYQSLFPENVEIIHWTKCFSKKIDIIKTNQMDGSVLAVVVKMVSGAKLVVRCGYEWLKTLRQANKPWYKTVVAEIVESFAYHHADRVLLTSRSDKEFIKRHFGVSDGQVKVIPNFVDTDLFIPGESEREEGRVIFVGRLEKEKNLINLITAMRGLNLRLVVVGSGSLRKELATLAQERGVPVEFKGSLGQREIVKELQQSDIFVLPSIYEGSPKALLEAMAVGLPAVGGNNEGIREVITDGVNGLLADPESDAIRACLEKLSGDAILRRQLGQRARETIVAGYSFDSYCRKELELFEHL